MYYIQFYILYIKVLVNICKEFHNFVAALPFILMRRTVQMDVLMGMHMNKTGTLSVKLLAGAAGSQKLLRDPLIHGDYQLSLQF